MENTQHKVTCKCHSLVTIVVVSGKIVFVTL